MEKRRKCAFLLLQNTWNEAIGKANEKIWVSIKHFGCEHSNDYGEIWTKNVEKCEKPIVVSSELFEVKDFHKLSIQVACPLFDISTQFVAPFEKFTKIHQKSITCIDISCGGGLGVSASSDQTLQLWDTTFGVVRRTFDGHFGEVNCCQFFPSGIVVLSGGMDTQLKIWSAETGSCARTLKGSHSGSILCTDVVDRGRNILSGSSDGSVMLWDCGSATCIASITKQKTRINDCRVAQLPSMYCKSLSSTANEDGDKDLAEQSKLEVGTEAKLIVTVAESGELKGMNLSRREECFTSISSSPINCCTFVAATTLVTGSEDGSIAVIDICRPSSPMVEHRCSGSPVLSLCTSRCNAQQPAFWVSFGDGRCSLMLISKISSESNWMKTNDRNSEETQMTNVRSCANGSFEAFDHHYDLILQTELSGPDCDPIYKVIESSDGYVYTAGRDAIIRKYKIFDGKSPNAETICNSSEIS